MSDPQAQAWTPPAAAADGAVPGWSSYPGGPLPHSPQTAAVPVDRRRSRSLALLAIAIGVGVILIAAVVASRSGGGAGHPTGATAPLSYITFHDPVGEFSLSTPPDWVLISTRGDITNLGGQVVPSNPVVANAVQTAANALPRSAVLLGFVRADLSSGHFATNVNLIPFPGNFSTMLSGTRTQLAQFGARIGSVTTMTIGGRAAARLTYRLGTGTAGALYLVDGGAKVWALTFSVSQLPDPARFDPIASTLVIVPTTSL